LLTRHTPPVPSPKASQVNGGFYANLTGVSSRTVMGLGAVFKVFNLLNAFGSPHLLPIGQESLTVSSSQPSVLIFATWPFVGGGQILSPSHPMMRGLP
jgi:hypothetical protein